jgi:hypothetical protein
MGIVGRNVLRCGLDTPCFFFLFFSFSNLLAIRDGAHIYSRHLFLYILP